MRVPSELRMLRALFGSRQRRIAPRARARTRRSVTDEVCSCLCAGCPLVVQRVSTGLCTRWCANAHGAREPRLLRLLTGRGVGWDSRRQLMGLRKDVSVVVMD